MGDDQGRAFAAGDVDAARGADWRGVDIVDAAEAERAEGFFAGCCAHAHEEALVVVHEVEPVSVEQGGGNVGSAGPAHPDQVFRLADVALGAVEADREHRALFVAAAEEDHPVG